MPEWMGSEGIDVPPAAPDCGACAPDPNRRQHRGGGCRQTILVRRATAAGQSSLSPHRTFVPLAGLHRLNPQVTGLCPARTSQVPGRRTRPDCRPCQRQLTTRDQRRRTRAAARRAESEVQLADAYV
jgi:hypothetical protein